MAEDTDALSVLEAIRRDRSETNVDADLLKAVYDVEHDKQFEADRGPVRATLRDLIEAAVVEEESQ